MADEASDLRLEERGDLRLDPAERERERLVPGHRPETLEGPDGGRRNLRGTRPGSRAGLAGQAAVAQGRAWERIGPPALDARIEPQPMAERLDASHAEGDRRARRRPRALERA